MSDIESNAPLSINSNTSTPVKTHDKNISSSFKANNPFLIDMVNNIGKGINKNFLLSQTEDTKKNYAKSNYSGKSNKKKNLFEFDEDNNRVIDDSLERKNFKKNLVSNRNIYFQMTSVSKIALELDFPMDESLLDIIQEQGAILDVDTSLYLAPFDKYHDLIYSIENLEYIENDRINIIPLAKITEDLVNNLQYNNLKFKMGKKLNEDFEIDYSNEGDKKLEDLPEDLINNLYTFQREGVKFAINRHARVLLADEMGVGKTIQAVCIAGLYPENWPVLIICPSSVKFCWNNEILIWLKHLVKSSDIQIVNKSKESLGDSKFFILTYDLAYRMEKELRKKYFNFCIVDECHSLKNMNSKRYEALMPIIVKSKRLLMLSGTPILAKPIEAFHVVHAIRPDIFSNFKPYGDRYCDPKPTQFGIDWSGQANTKELHFVMSTLMIRRLKKNVLSQLPPKKRQKIALDCDPEIVKKVKQYLDIKFPKNKERVKGDNQNASNDKNKMKKDDDNVNANDNQLHSDNNKPITFTEAYSLTGLAKLKGIKNYIRYLLQNNCKFIIFAYHLSVLDSIEDLLINFEVKYIRIDGKVLNEKRDEAVNTFQNEDNCRVAILGITACATGITLTAASTVLFAELYFTPAIMIQAEDRIHRIGQEHSCVNIDYLYGADTIDEIIFPRLRDKYFVVTTTLDDKKLDLGLQKLEEGSIGEFSTNKKFNSNLTQVINKDEDEFDEFREEIKLKYGLIINKNEFNSINDNEIINGLNMHDNGKSIRVELEKEDETYEDETNYSLDEYNLIETRKYKISRSEDN